MKKAPIFVLLLSLSALASFGPVVSASHESSMFVVSGFTANTEHWINLLKPDFSGCLRGRIDYPANTLFFVSHGWGIPDWTALAGIGQNAVASEATTFMFLIDGQLQMQSRVYQYNFLGIPDLMVKLFNTEYHDGLTGSHLFTGQFYLDASLFGGNFGDPSLVFECNLKVNFAS